MNTITAPAARAGRNLIGDAFTRSVRRNPGRTALIFTERNWTFKQLDQAVNQVANQLIDAGLKTGDRVAAYGRNSDAYVILWLACTKAGLIHVPVNYALLGDELKYILDQSDAKAIFYDKELAEPIAKVQMNCAIQGTINSGTGTDILQWATGTGNTAAPEIDLDPEAIAQLLYTSGTTAAPKGAMMSHRALMAEYTSTLIATDIRADDISLAALPLYHSAQMHVFMMPQLLVGAKTILISAPLPDICFDIIAREKITSFFAPPTVWISFLRNSGFDPAKMTSIQKGYYGASIMPVPVVKELAERMPDLKLYNCYGQSEIAPLATVLRPEDHTDRPSSAGKPIFNVETRIVDENMNDMPAGEMGEIVHRSPQLMSGYWNKPEATAEAFAGDWFHSGDVGHMDEAGYLYITDRIKDIINTGGVVVASREVEECLYTHPAVAEVAVIGLPDEKWIEAITAVVTLKQGASVSAEELTQHVHDRLAAFKVPKQIHFVEDMPRNASGKLLKRQLRQKYSN